MANVALFCLYSAVIFGVLSVAAGVAEWLDRREQRRERESRRAAYREAVWAEHGGRDA